MAINIIFEPAEHLAVICSHPTTPASGDPVRYGRLTGVALIDEQTDGYTTVNIGQFVADMSVAAVNDSGNSAVALGDEIYYTDADTPRLSKKSSGMFFGIATETITSGSTDTIRVLHFPAGTLGFGNVTSTLGTGFIPLDISNAVLLSAGAVQNTTEGGRPDGNSAPLLTRTNGATDIALRLEWVASSVAEIQWSVPLPPDLNDAAVLTLNLLLEKDTNTDTTTNVAVKLFQGKGDSNAGGNTAAIATATLAKYTVVMAAVDVLATSGTSAFLNVALVPGTHGSDAIRCYAAWITYTRS